MSQAIKWHQTILFRTIPKRETFLLMLHLTVSLNLPFYESLHSTATPETEQAQFSKEIQEIQDVEDRGKINLHQIDIASKKYDFYLKATKELDKVSATLKNTINKNDTEFNEAIIKLSKRYHDLTQIQRVSSLHSFGG